MSSNKINASITAFFLQKFAIDICICHLWTRDGLVTLSQKMEVAG